MLTVLRNIPVVLRWLPLVMTGVSLMEGLFGSGKPGVEKKGELLAWLRQVGDKSGLSWSDSALPVVSALIDLVVDIMNFFQKFRHAGDVPEGELEAQVRHANESRPAAEESVSRVKVADPELARFLEDTARE